MKVIFLYFLLYVSFSNPLRSQNNIVSRDGFLIGNKDTLFNKIKLYYEPISSLTSPQQQKIFQTSIKCLIETIPTQLTLNEFDFLSNPSVSIEEKMNFFQKSNLLNFHPYQLCLKQKNIQIDSIFVMFSEVLMWSVSKTLVSVRLEGRNAPFSLVKELEVGTCLCLMKKYNDKLPEVENLLLLINNKSFFQEFDRCLLSSLKIINKNSK
jgi:hypothetical protein